MQSSFWNDITRHNNNKNCQWIILSWQTPVFLICKLIVIPVSKYSTAEKQYSNCLLSSVVCNMIILKVRLKFIYMIYTYLNNTST